MKININTKHIDLTDALAHHVRNKVSQVEKFLDKNDGSIMCDVEIGTSTTHHQSGEIFCAEINLHTAGHDYRVVSEKDDLYFAINQAKDEIVDAVRSHRKKEQTLVKRGGARVKNILKGFLGK